MTVKAEIEMTKPPEAGTGKEWILLALQREHGFPLSNASPNASLHYDE